MAALPNPFAMKLRKHLRTRRLEGIRQCGFDRVLQIIFGTGEHAYHIFVELHSGGNIILTDSSLIIMSLLRPYETTSTGKVAVHQRYPIEQSTPMPQIPDVIEGGDKSLLSTCAALGWPKQLVSECLRELSLDETVNASLPAVVSVLSAVDAMISRLKALDVPTTGYLFSKDGKNTEFSSVFLKEHDGKDFKQFPTLNEAMDAFYSNLESLQKIQQSVKTETKALSKEEKMQRDLDQRIKNLESTSVRNQEIARLIEDNLDLVENVISALRTELANGIAWQELERFVAEERAHGQNPVAACIKSLQFEKNSITLALGEKKVAVSIDLGLSAHANANLYYNAKKKAAGKSERTQMASEIALRSAKLQSQKDLKKAQKLGTVGAKALSVRRKIHWFEKFYWFITSENFLVIGGRDAQQNELLVRRHLGPKDLYFHADLHGASSVVLLNPDGLDPVPVRSLEEQEAAQFSVCRSAAWTSKAIASAYWVKADQVSKTAPTGMSIATGAFMVRGKRNYMPPSQLIFGFTFIFRVTDDCLHRHAHERNPNEDQQDVNQLSMQMANATASFLADAAPTGSNEENVEVMSIPDALDNQHEASIDALKDKHAQINDDEDIDAEVVETGSVGAIEIDGAQHSVSANAEKALNQPSNNHRETASFDVTSSLLLPQQFSVNYNRGLFAANGELEDEESEDMKRPQPRLTARQRKLLKKTGRIEEPTMQKAQPAAIVVTPTESAPAVLPRGKRSKIKKIKSKYADQDEVDRDRALQLLGTSTVKEVHGISPDIEDGTNEKAATASDTEEGSDFDVSPSMLPEQDWLVKICFNCSEQGHVVRDCPALAGVDKTILNKAVQLGRDHDREEITGPNIIGEEFNLHSLTGLPHEEDEILYALPMCAPYSSIHDYRFKVKVIPGNEKRGTAAKSCTALVMRMCEGSDAEKVKTVIKAGHDGDVATVLPPSSKVSAPGIGSIKTSNDKKSVMKRNKGPKNR